MTDEQIVKALECCSTARAVKCHDCAYCGKNLDKHCTFALTEDALAYIERLKAEIEDLKADKEAIINGQLTLQKMYCESRAEAIREFAEFLIGKAENNLIRIGDLYEYVIDFNEMTEKEGGNV